MTFRCGDIVLLPFPFTDLSAAMRDGVQVELRQFAAA
jgi:hypothetical protein